MPVPVVMESVSVEGLFRGSAEPEVVIDIFEVTAVERRYFAIDGIAEERMALMALGRWAVGVSSNGFSRLEAKDSRHINVADYAVVD